MSAAELNDIAGREAQSSNQVNRDRAAIYAQRATAAAIMELTEVLKLYGPRFIAALQDIDTTLVDIDTTLVDVSQVACPVCEAPLSEPSGGVIDPGHEATLQAGEYVVPAAMVELTQDTRDLLTNGLVKAVSPDQLTDTRIPVATMHPLSIGCANCGQLIYRENSESRWEHAATEKVECGPIPGPCDAMLIELNVEDTPCVRPMGHAGLHQSANGKLVWEDRS